MQHNIDPRSKFCTFCGMSESYLLNGGLGECYAASFVPQFTAMTVSISAMTAPITFSKQTFWTTTTDNTPSMVADTARDLFPSFEEIRRLKEELAMLKGQREEKKKEKEKSAEDLLKDVVRPLILKE